MALTIAAAPGPPSPLNTLVENAPVQSEALLNKPVDCVLLGVSALAVRGDLSLH